MRSRSSSGPIFIGQGEYVYLILTFIYEYRKEKENLKEPDTNHGTNAKNFFPKKKLYPAVD